MTATELIEALCDGPQEPSVRRSISQLLTDSQDVRMDADLCIHLAKSERNTEETGASEETAASWALLNKPFWTWQPLRTLPAGYRAFRFLDDLGRVRYGYESIHDA